MKKILYFTLGVVILLTTSCNKDDLNFTASMTAKVNGESWSTITRVARHFTSTNMYTITGTSTNGQVIILTVRGDAEGTYNSSASIDDPSAQVGAVYQPDATSPAADNFVSKSGTVVITKIDTENQLISGTFEFEMTKLSETMSIAEGKFDDIKYGESSE